MEKTRKKKGSYYKLHDDARTFKVEFYYVNFIDAYGKFDSTFSVKIDDLRHALNRAKWYVNHLGALSSVDYYVRKVGVYSSIRGHMKTFILN